MRPRLAWLVAAGSVGLGGGVGVGLAACSGRPLPVEAPPPGPDAGEVEAGRVDAGDAGKETGPPPGVLDWAVPIGSQPSPAAAGTTTVKAVVAVDDGGAIVAGSFTGSVAFAADTVRDGTPGSGFVARYRRDQRLVWVHVLGAGDDGRVVVADAASLGDGETVVTGWFDGTLTERRDSAPIAVTSAGGVDAFVARLASDGSVRWFKRGGGPGDDIGRGVAVGASAGGARSIAITGAISGGAVFGPGEAGETRAAVSDGPVFAARLDGDGALVWVRFAGGGVPGQGYGVAHDGAAAVAVTGYVNGVAAFGNDVRGAPVSLDPATGRAFVARWDSGGRLLWAHPIGGPMGEGDAVAIGASGAIVAVGLFQGEARFGSGAAAPTLIADSPGQDGAYLAAFAGDGATLWARRLVGIGIRPWRLRAASDGDLLLAASFGGGIVLDPDGAWPVTLFATDRSTDALFARLGGDGSLRWASAGGGPGAEQGADFAAARDGTSWAVGTYYGPATFGAGSAFGAGAAARLESGTDGGSFLLRLLAPAP